MKRLLIVSSLILSAILFLGWGFGERAGENKKTSMGKTAITGDYVKFDVNNISTFIRNNGSFNRDPGSGSSGFEWPKNSGNYAIYASGLWMGAKTPDGVVRVAIAEYSYEYEAGPIAPGVNPQDDRWRVYKIKRGDNALNNPDYANWPFDDGAPALRNYNNTADSLDENGNRIPLLLGDMTVWCVFNDNNPAVHVNQKTPPLGVEVQLTAWAYNRGDALGDAIFYRWKLINKGGRQLDSMYVCIWADPDVGDSGDDYDGCDTTLGLGYTYNGATVDGVYGIKVPATGFDFLQGPIVPSPGDVAVLPDGTILPDKKILKMTSYLKYNNDNSDLGNPQTGIETYNYFRGLTRTGLDILDPNGNKAMFMYPGDPTQPSSATNWIETGATGDRRFMMSTGPFTMAPGDTQVIVAGNLIAVGSDNLSSVTALKQADQLVQTAYNLDFKLPQPPPAPKVEYAPISNGVILTWGKDENYADAIESYEAVDKIAAAGGIEDTVYRFQGYVVYQFQNAAGANPKIVETFDVVDVPAVGVVYDDVFDPDLGYYVHKPVKFGSDKGISRSIVIKKDAYTGLPLVNEKTYYFAVTSYSYNKGSIPKTLESAVNIIAVRPRQPMMGNSFNATGYDSLGTPNPVANYRKTVPRVQGSSDGFVIAKIIQPDSVTGDTYEVRFTETGGELSYNIVNVTKNTTIVTNRTAMADDENHPIRDGIMFKVVEPPHELNPAFGDGGVEVEPADPNQWWLAPNGDVWGMPYFYGGIDLGSHIDHYLGFTSNSLPFNQYKKVRIIFDSTNKAYVHRYRRTNVGGVTRYRFQDMAYIGIQAWDITDPNNPRQLSLAWRDQNNDGQYTPALGVDNTAEESYLEVLIVSPRLYDGSNPVYGPEGGPWEEDAMYILALGRIPDKNFFESPMAITIQPYYGFSTSDVYRIETANYKATPGDVAVAKTQIERINVVPNPYFGANAYEQNQFDRKVRITNLPAKATIRIFNLMGELVKKIEKNDPATSTVDWDLNNTNDLPVASGMYIIHVDMGDIGTKVLKLAVIQAEERLNNF